MLNTSFSGIFAAHEPLSLLPRTAVTGAIFASSSRTCGEQISPVCRMCSTPLSAAIASGRSKSCVSEMTPIRASLLAARATSHLQLTQLSAENDHRNNKHQSDDVIVRKRVIPRHRCDDATQGEHDQRKN